MAGKEVDGQKVRWRWVDAVRYMVALAMTALIVAVITHATVLLRSDHLFVRVGGDQVLVKRVVTSNRSLTFGINLEFTNPSGRVAVYYTDITAYFYGRVNQTQDAEYFMATGINDIAPDISNIALQQQMVTWTFVEVYPNSDDLDKAYTDFFYSTNSSIPEAMVVVNGTLVVEIDSVRNKTAQASTYYCSHITISVDSPEDPSGGAWCSMEPPTPQADLNAP